jgi:hypothetical protein
MRNLFKVAVGDCEFPFKASRILGRSVPKMNSGASKAPSN